MAQEGNSRVDRPITATETESVEAARLRDDIKETRAHLSGTIDELQKRLRPQHLVSQAGDAVRGAMEERLHTMAETMSETASRWTTRVQEHPLQTAVALAGFGWWLMRDRRPAWERRAYATSADIAKALAAGAVGYALLKESDRRRHLGDGGNGWAHAEASMAEEAAGLRDRVADRAGQYAERIGQEVRTLGQTAGEIGQRAAQSASEYTGQVGAAARSQMQEAGQMLRERTEQLENTFERLMNENPLSVGIAALALGAIAGLSFPATETEGRALGAARDTLMNKAAQAVDSTLSSH